MKKNTIFATLAALLIVPTVVMANAPVIDITAPVTGTTIYTSVYPFNVPISYNVSHDAGTFQPEKDVLKNITNLEVSVNNFSLFSTPLNPFDQNNQCSNDMVLPNVSNCNASDEHHGSVTTPWSVTKPGTYSITVSAWHRNEEGVDTEVAEIQTLLINVEYPAPPSVANAYIKSKYSKLSSGIKGCIISEIANNHAKDSKYGPKGGPYDTSLIQGDVESYKTTCTGL
jgi:hypothetical protein